MSELIHHYFHSQLNWKVGIVRCLLFVVYVFTIQNNNVNCKLRNSHKQYIYIQNDGCQSICQMPTIPKTNWSILLLRKCDSNQTAKHQWTLNIEHVCKFDWHLVINVVIRLTVYFVFFAFSIALLSMWYLCHSSQLAAHSSQ